MSMRLVLFHFSFLFVLLTPYLAIAQEGQPHHKNERPNIIFILTDDQRFDALGHAGNPLAHTPEMDLLAQQGTYFKEALVTTPICAASRASILTGLYERAHNYNFRTGNIREEYMQTAYPKLLKEAGYWTGFYGKYGVRYNNLNEQFDVYESYDRNGAFKDRRGYYYKTIDEDTVHLTRYTGQKALDFLDNIQPQRAFCLSLSFSAPHAHDSAPEQYFWQKETNDILQNTEVPAPELGQDQYFMAEPEMVRKGFNRTRWYWRYDTPEKYQHSIKGYYRMIAGIDLELGKIRAKLKEKGLDQNTIILLMGDNGYFMGERQLAGKWLMYENSIRVPLIIYDPRSPKSLVTNTMALNVDVPSTILDFAQIPQPTSWQGKSLVPIMQNQHNTLQRDTVLIEHLWEFDPIPPSEGVRTKDWKYFRYVNDKSIERLYYLKEDPKEINNLAEDPNHQSILIKLRAACDQLIQEKSNAYRLPPSDLSIEFIREPQEVAILDPSPEYSWVVPQGAVTQLAYQILVASSEQNLSNNIGDIWDSGRVRSNQSYNIHHKGDALIPGRQYYWKVRIWDQANRLVDYSKPQSFAIGQPEKMITTANQFMREAILPQAVHKLDQGYLLDFGKAAFATLEFTYDSKDSRTLMFHVGEKLRKDNRVDRNPGGHIRYQALSVPVRPGKHTYQLPIKVDKRNTIPNKAVQLPDFFPVLMPFRYVEVLNTEGTLKLQDYRQLAYFNYWKADQSYFSCDNEVLNQVWDLCKYSIKATTFAGLYVDGDRERIPYEADAYLNQLSHYATDREYAIARRTIEYFMEYPTWPTEWQLHVTLMVHADYMYTGNTELIEKYYEPLKQKSLMELRDTNGLISSSKATPVFMQKLGFKDPDATLRDIVDWPPAGWQGNPEVIGERDGFDFQPYNTVINALYYQNMKIMVEFAHLLGNTADAAQFELLAIQAYSALNEQMFDQERGIYRDGIGTEHASLHANMFPLAFNMVPQERIPTVVEFIKSRRMACSVYGAQYLLDALYNAGEADYALELMADTTDRSWYNMIRIGSTITLEAWDMKYKPNADWNHAWGAVPANIITRRMWGITPQTAGGRILNIQPQLGNLKTSDITVPFLTGTVKAFYQKVNNRLQQYTFELPANVSGTLMLKRQPNESVELDGQPVDQNFSTIRLTPGKHEISIRLNSF